SGPVGRPEGCARRGADPLRPGPPRRGDPEGRPGQARSRLRRAPAPDLELALRAGRIVGTVERRRARPGGRRPGTPVAPCPGRACRRSRRAPASVAPGPGPPPRTPRLLGPDGPPARTRSRCRRLPPRPGPRPAGGPGLLAGRSDGPGRRGRTGRGGRG